MTQDYWSQYAPAPQSKQPYKPSPDDNKTLGDMAKALPTLRTLAQRSQEAMAVQGTGDNALPTGPALAKWNVGGMDLNPIRGAVAALAAVAPNASVPFTGGTPAGKLATGLQRLDQINSATFALNRPEGSGRILQSEVPAFKQATTSTANYGTNNAALAAQQAKEYQDKLGQYQFVSNFVKSGHGSAADALAAYDAQQGGAPPVPGPAVTAQPPAPVSPQAQLNAALIAKSAQAQQQAQAAQQPPAQVPHGTTVDIFGRPVQ
jgi:hypothetical protein